MVVATGVFSVTPQLSWALCHTDFLHWLYTGIWTDSKLLKPSNCPQRWFRSGMILRDDYCRDFGLTINYAIRKIRKTLEILQFSGNAHRRALPDELLPVLGHTAVPSEDGFSDSRPSPSCMVARKHFSFPKCHPSLTQYHNGASCGTSICSILELYSCITYK